MVVFWVLLFSLFFYYSDYFRLAFRLRFINCLVVLLPVKRDILKLIAGGPLLTFHDKTIKFYDLMP